MTIKDIGLSSSFLSLLNANDIINVRRSLQHWCCSPTAEFCRIIVDVGQHTNNHHLKHKTNSEYSVHILTEED